MPPVDRPSRERLKAATAGGILTIDLDALRANYRALAERAAPALCSAAVKADAYGLGLAPVARALSAAGCRIFLVADLEEGARLREILPQAEIHVLTGPTAGTEADFAGLGLTPVLNDPAQIDLWAAFSRRRETPLAGVLHLDTGMNRLGLTPEDARALAAEPNRLEGVMLTWVMSHLACSDEPDHEMNARQLALFNELRGSLPPAPASLANSGGIFLGSAYHLDMVRPGIALYGGNPLDHGDNPMAQVVHLQGRILQVRRVDSPMTVGYGATHGITGPGRLATVGVGYADGYLRALSNRGFGAIDGVKVPIVGRVSMDLITLDVSRIPAEQCAPGTLVDLIGGAIPLDVAAAAAGSVSYELLTRLGPRLHRVYKGGA